MAKAYIFLADGFEEVEALATVDILRRGGVVANTVSVTGSEFVTTSHGVTIKADMAFDEVHASKADMLILPGGLPGADNLGAHEGLCSLLVRHCNDGGYIAAICAAPKVFGALGLLKGRRATCYPGFERFFNGGEYTHELCIADGNIITGEGPAATFPFAYKLLSLLTDAETADQVAEGMMYKHLMGR